MSGRRDSNPLQKLGRLLCYRYTTPAKVKQVWLSVSSARELLICQGLLSNFRHLLGKSSIGKRAYETASHPPIS